MKKKVVALVMTAAFAAAVGIAWAAIEKCKVEEVKDDGTVIMKCEGTKLKAGDEVKVDKKKVEQTVGC